MRNVSIIGIGRLGGALSLALSRRGYVIDSLLVRNPQTAEKIALLIEPPPPIKGFDRTTEINSGIIILTTQDSEIASAAAALREKIKGAPPVVFHTSGALSSEILEPLREIGCRLGSLHPLVSLSDARLGAERFSEAYFCVEGDAEAVMTANEIVAALGGRAFSIDSKAKILYHAAAVTACGHLVALIDAAIEMLGKCGMQEDAARATLLPLIKSTVGNLEMQTPAEALTGTFARADLATFEKHLAALEENVYDETREIYLDLGARSAHLARRQGADSENLAKILAKISLAKKNFRC